jgi:hypothetical protein
MSVYLLATIMEGPREYQLTMTSSERREEEIIMEPLQTLRVVVVVPPPWLRLV